MGRVLLIILAVLMAATVGIYASYVHTGECVYRAGRALAQKKQINPPRGALRSLAPRVATRTRPPGYSSRFCPATDPH
jgi:hypothetical protein